MHPILFEFGNVSVSSFSFMLSLAFIVSTLTAIFTCKRQIISINNIFGLMILIQISGFLGSRLFFVLNNYSQFEGNLSKIFSLSPGGFSFSGGLFFSMLTCMVYIKWAKLHFWKISDCAVYPIAVGIFLTKIGCFLGGCCYGRETSSFLGVQFPTGSFAAQKYGSSHSVHPTQLYEAFSSLIVLAIIMVIIRKNPKFTGELFLSFMILFLSARTLNESLRGDVAHDFFLNLSRTQIIGVIFVLCAFLAYGIKLHTSKAPK
jgi:phosphatidylglycerol:prolipoprotein diacylglycerol transferase